MYSYVQLCTAMHSYVQLCTAMYSYVQLCTAMHLRGFNLAFLLVLYRCILPTVTMEVQMRSEDLASFQEVSWLPFISPFLKNTLIIEMVQIADKHLENAHYFHDMQTQMVHCLLNLLNNTFKGRTGFRSKALPFPISLFDFNQKLQVWSCR